jgi:hypothetical protein
VLLDGQGSDLLSLAADNSHSPGLSALTLAVERDPHYRLVATGPCNREFSTGLYAIWRHDGSAK